jgi:hypothetical protein
MTDLKFDTESTRRAFHLPSQGIWRAANRLELRKIMGDSERATPKGAGADAATTQVEGSSGAQAGGEMRKLLDVALKEGMGNPEKEAEGPAAGKEVKPERPSSETTVEGSKEKKPSTDNVEEATRKRPTRSWTEEQRLHHRLACKAKGKLSLGQKLDIIAQHQSRNPERRKTQAQLAQLYGKSRSAISKILRPENIAKLKNISDTGVHKGVKRYSHVLPQLELEKRIHEMMVERAGNAAACVYYGRRAEVMAFAQKVAREAGVVDFRPTYGWYARFLKRHGLAESAEEALRGDADMDGESNDSSSEAHHGSDDERDEGAAGKSKKKKRKHKTEGRGGGPANDLQALVAAIKQEEMSSNAADTSAQLARQLSPAQLQQLLLVLHSQAQQDNLLGAASGTNSAAAAAAAAAAKAAVAAVAASQAAANAAAFSRSSLPGSGAQGQGVPPGLGSWFFQPGAMVHGVGGQAQGNEAVGRDLAASIQAAQTAQENLAQNMQLNNTAAAASALLNLQKMAATNQMQVNLECLGIDPVALAGLGLATSQALGLPSSQALEQQASQPPYLHNAAAPYQSAAQGASAFSHCPTPPRAMSQQMLGVGAQEWAGAGGQGAAGAVSQAQPQDAQGSGSLNANSWQQQAMPVKRPQPVHALNSGSPPQTSAAGGGYAAGQAQPQGAQQASSASCSVTLPSLSDSLSRLSAIA